MPAWYTADSAGAPRLVAAWPDAPIENEEVMQMILETAKEQVVAFGDPADATEQTEVNEDGYLVTSTTPARWVYAQLQQAKNLWNAGRVNSAGTTGMDSYSFTPRPLDKTIRSIIRPQGVPNVV